MATPRNAAAAADTMARQWLILQHIPRFPGHTSSASLHTMLEGEGHHVTRRTLERDLVALTTRFPLECDDSQKPFAWCWSRHAKVFDIPGMEPAAALAFRLVQIWGSRMLPGATQTALQPHFSRAQQVLKDNGMLSRWTEKIRIVERGPPTHPPKVADGVLQVVYAALLQDRWCTVNYRARGSDTPQTHQLNPLGLIVTHGLLYLVCTINAHQDPRQLLLHRMSDARPLDRERVQPKDFDLDTYLRDGNLGLPLDSKPIKLKALFHGQAAHTVAETPLSGDQTVRPGANGALEVHATVADTLDLRGWIFGFGEMVEVLAPQSLRDEFKRRIKALSKMYVK